MGSSDEISVRVNVPCALSDGTVLRADVYSPTTDEAVPVLLLRHPYSKSAPMSMRHMDVQRAVLAGYIVVIQDVRGRYASDGVFVPSLNEQRDGYEVVQWAAQLPGCNGRVGTWGASYGAETQWSAALGRPPALRSMVVTNAPSHSASDGFLLRGGAHEFGSRLNWAHNSIAFEELRRQNASRPDGLQRTIDAHASVHELFDSGEVYDARPFREVGAEEPFMTAASQTFHDAVDEEWRTINKTAGHYDDIDQAIFMIGGWYDVFIGSTLRQYAGIHRSAQANGSVAPHLVIGPWSHIESNDRLAQLPFGTRSSALFPGDDMSMSDQHLRWYDATLKDRPDALDGLDAVRLFVMGSNSWVGTGVFPPAAESQEWYLAADGALGTEQPPAESESAFDYDPSDPVPTIGGAILMAPPHVAGPIDQSPLYARGDVLSFTSEPLSDAVTVIGAIEATLWASTSAADTDFVVRLCDVHPDGRSMVLADGIVRASLVEREGGRLTRRAIEPGAAVEYRIDLLATANTFLPGHRIRLDVTSSSYPRWDPNPNTGRSIFDDATSVVAHQRIHSGPVHPSRVTLPVVDITAFRAI